MFRVHFGLRFFPHITFLLNKREEIFSNFNTFQAFFLKRRNARAELKPKSLVMFLIFLSSKRG